MADKKITELPELTEVAADDYLEIVDTSTNTNKKISRETLTNFAWQSWTPTLTGWSSTTALSCNYMKMGKILFFTVIIAGTSDSTTTTFSLPESAILTEYSGVMGFCINNGSILTAAARYYIAQGSNICKAYTDMASGAWTASGTKSVSVYGWIATN